MYIHKKMTLTVDFKIIHNEIQPEYPGQGE